MKTLPSQPNQSLMDGLRLLEALAARPHPVACTALAKELGMELTRVNRLVKTLHHMGFAHRDHSRKYGPGAGLLVLSAATLNTLGLFRNGLKALEDLREEKLVTAMGVLWRDRVSYFYHWSPGQSLEDAVGRMELFPATRSSIGLVLLASHDDETVRDLYGREPIPGFSGWKELKAFLDGARRDGHAAMESPGGGVSLGVPVGDPPFAGIAVSGVRGAREISRLSARLKTLAAFISERARVAT